GGEPVPRGAPRAADRLDVGSPPGRRPAGRARVHHELSNDRVGHPVGRPRHDAARGPGMGGQRVKRGTIAVHGGYQVDPTTRAVAVPIYQTVSYAFDSADHGAALFNLEVEGYRYTRIGNPTTAVLERRLAALEGGIEALCVASGQAAVHYAALNLTDLG